MEQQEDYHYRFKIVLIGDNEVGKSSLLDAMSTFGKPIDNEIVDELHFKYEDQGNFYRFNYWDLPGSERYMKVVSRFAAGSTAAIFVFDASKRSTFERMEAWINECSKSDIQVKILVGNKTDLCGTKKSHGDVNKTEALGLARKYGMDYFEVSCVNREGIAQVYEHLYNMMIQAIPNPPDPGMLLGKGISIGVRLITNPKFKIALFDTDTKYD